MARCIYIDSRFRESGTASDFRWNLRGPIELHDGAMGYVDSFCCSNVFNSVVTGHNDSLYFRQTMGLLRFDKRLRLPPGQYTAASLAVQIQSLINEYALIQYTYTCSATSDGTQLLFASDIPVGGTARIISTVELESAFPDWGDQNDLFFSESYFQAFGATGGLFADGGDFIDSGQLDRRDPEDAGELIGVTDGTNRFFQLTTNFVNLMPYRTLYLTSGSVGTANSWNPKGEQSQIIKQKPSLLIACRDKQLSTDLMLRWNRFTCLRVCRVCISLCGIEKEKR